MSDYRAEQIQSLRTLADLLDAEPDLPFPYLGTITWGVWGEDAKAEVARIARLIPGRLSKSQSSDAYYRLTGQIGTLDVGIAAYRDAVCEAVISTETVTVVERDPQAVEAAIADIPEVEVTKEISVTEWVCSPLLAEVVA